MLATASDEYRLTRVALMLASTLVIYWAAETYVHLALIVLKSLLH